MKGKKEKRREREREREMEKVRKEGDPRGALNKKKVLGSDIDTV